MDIVEKVKDGAGKVAKTTKDAFDKAGSAVQKFSDKNVLKLEIKRLQKKKEVVYHDLGKDVAVLFLVTKRKSVSCESDVVKGYLQSILDIEKEIKEKEEELANIK